MKVSFTKVFYPIASCLFVALLLLPLAEERFHFIPVEISFEEITQKTPPEFKKDSATFFPKKFEAYYKQNFGCRRWLINRGSRVKYYGFGASPLPEQVTVGKENWLFLTGRSYQITQDLTRENLYKEGALEKLVKQWEARKQELAVRNIKFYKGFWPDKHYIYPEKMSWGMQKADMGGVRRCDLAIAYLKKVNSPIAIIDVRALLIEAKSKQKVYLKNDSHWNEYGSFLAYHQLLKALSVDFSQLQPYEAGDFRVDSVIHHCDLSNIINMSDWGEYMPVFKLKSGNSTAIELPADGYPSGTKVYRNDSATTKLRALIYRDSFTNALIPFLMLHFSEVVFIWDTDYSLEMVDRVKPDLVIECYASRYFR